MKRRVVVTGLGVVSSIGIGKDEFWKNLISGKSGISDVVTFDTTGYSTHRGGEIKELKLEKFGSHDIFKDIGKASQFAVISTILAVNDSHIGIKTCSRIGVVSGTTMADIQALEQIVKYWVRSGENYIWPIHIPKYPANNLSGHMGFLWNIKGLNMVIPTACSAGNYSIGFAYDLISQNKMDIALAGGSDVMSRTNFAGFNRLVAMSPDRCTPFDKNRKGILIGEGAATLVLEDLDLAKKRNANIYAEIIGYGLSCDANNMTAPRLDGVIKSIERAMKNSGIQKEDVGYISAHGTGTPLNDKIECEAVRKVFGDNTKNISMSSIKSMLGHTMGAASAIEAVACCMVIKESVMPPTINYETFDPNCDIDCVPNVAKKKNVKVVLNNSFAFGGNNACVVLKKIYA